MPLRYVLRCVGMIGSQGPGKTVKLVVMGQERRNGATIKPPLPIGNGVLFHQVLDDIGFGHAPILSLPGGPVNPPLTGDTECHFAGRGVKDRLTGGALGPIIDL